MRLVVSFPTCFSRCRNSTQWCILVHRNFHSCRHIYDYTTILVHVLSTNIRVQYASDLEASPSMLVDKNGWQLTKMCLDQDTWTHVWKFNPRKQYPYSSAAPKRIETRLATVADSTTVHSSGTSELETSTTVRSYSSNLNSNANEQHSSSNPPSYISVNHELSELIREQPPYQVWAPSLPAHQKTPNLACEHSARSLKQLLVWTRRAGVALSARIGTCLFSVRTFFSPAVSRLSTATCCRFQEALSTKPLRWSKACSEWGSTPLFGDSCSAIRCNISKGSRGRYGIADVLGWGPFLMVKESPVGVVGLLSTKSL